MREEFTFNSGYARNWQTIISNPELLKEKANEVEKLKEKLLQLLQTESELLLELDQDITFEYNTNRLEISLYERELEIAKMRSSDNLSDEEYCYVYTLECELFVFMWVLQQILKDGLISI